jgi:hypothetical protein
VVSRNLGGCDLWTVCVLTAAIVVVGFIDFGLVVVWPFLWGIGMGVIRFSVWLAERVSSRRQIRAIVRATDAARSGWSATSSTSDPERRD